MVAIAVPLNTIFGIACALVLVRHKFRGKAILNALIDMPFAISPVVIGLRARARLRRRRLVRRLVPRAGDPGHLLGPGHGDGDDLRLAAVRGARGRAGAARDRRRPGAGRRDARRQRLADLLAGDAARRSAGASPTASSSRRLARSASSARSRSSPAGSPARPRRCRCSSRSSSRSSTSRAPTRRRWCSRCSRS